MITETSTAPTPDVLPADPPRNGTPRRLSKSAMAIMVLLIACVTGAILLLAGVFETSSSDIKLDPVSNKPATATSTSAAPRLSDAKVVVDYLAAMKSWNECMVKHAGDATTDKCGAMPEQVDDPALNAYLAEVLNWNKCAAPLLKKGATAEAEKACGPSPAVPTTD